MYDKIKEKGEAKIREIKKSRLLNFLIPCGMIFFTACAIFAFFVTPPKFVEVLFCVFLITQCVFGLLICIFSLILTQRATQLFIGMLFLSCGILQIIDNSFDFVGLKELWPVYSILAGIILFISGFYKYRKIKFGYIIPSVTIFGMGIWFSLFTFSIIKVPFVNVVSFLGPIFMGLIVVLLVVFFLLQRKYKELIVSDDENGTFSDEEDAFMDLVNEEISDSATEEKNQ